MLNKILKTLFDLEMSGKLRILYWRKLSSIFGLLLIMLLVISSNLMAFGTEPTGDPREVSTLDHLLWISTNSSCWGDDFIQTANFDASITSTWNWNGSIYEGFSPIGNDASGFAGSYNGQNHTIDGLYINRPSVVMDYVGLFGRLQSGTLQNLGVTNVNITGYMFVGGLVGFNLEYSSVSNCYSTGTVSGYHTVGGLVGYNMTSPSVSNSYSTTSVTGTNNYVGGLVGFNHSNSSVSNCYSTGSVSGIVQVGGLVGTNSESTVSNSYSTGSVTGEQSVGGLVGYNDLSSVSDSYSTGSVSGFYDVGGLVGDNNSTVSCSFWDTETCLPATTSAGGIGKTTTEMTTDAQTYPNFYTVAGWDFKGVGTEGIWNIGNSRNSGYPYLDWQYPSDPATLPVTLSSFTAQYIENTPTLYWTTQSETDNMGWFVYRNIEEDFTTSEKISEFIEGHGTTTQQQSYLYEDRIQNPEVGDIYNYWLESIDYSGIINHYDKVAVLTIPEQYDPGNGLIPELVLYGLLQNKPNPVISSTKISFNLPETSQVELNIYNLKGQLVKSLYSGFTSSKTFDWNGEDESGNVLKAGVYLYKLLVNGKTEETKKLIMMK